MAELKDALCCPAELLRANKSPKLCWNEVYLTGEKKLGSPEEAFVVESLQWRSVRVLRFFKADYPAHNRPSNVFPVSDANCGGSGCLCLPQFIGVLPGDFYRKWQGRTRPSQVVKRRQFPQFENVLVFSFSDEISGSWSVSVVILLCILPH